MIRQTALNHASSAVRSFVIITLTGVAITACGGGTGNTSTSSTNYQPTPDPQEQADTDGDGVFDNSDTFPNDPGESKDSDGDGVGDNSDAFPLDPNESRDTDLDGVGDNSDAFPLDPNESQDTDLDGVGNNADAFPNNDTETEDTDGDGVGDNSDKFPNNPDFAHDNDGDGIADSIDDDDDNDGTLDQNDPYPLDPTLGPLNSLYKVNFSSPVQISTEHPEVILRDTNENNALAIIDRSHTKTVYGNLNVLPKAYSQFPTSVQFDIFWDDNDNKRYGQNQALGVFFQNELDGSPSFSFGARAIKSESGTSRRILLYDRLRNEYLTKPLESRRWYRIQVDSHSDGTANLQILNKSGDNAFLTLKDVDFSIGTISRLSFGRPPSTFDYVGDPAYKLSRWNTSDLIEGSSILKFRLDDIVFSYATKPHVVRDYNGAVQSITTMLSKPHVLSSMRSEKLSNGHASFNQSIVSTYGQVSFRFQSNDYNYPSTKGDDDFLSLTPDVTASNGALLVRIPKEIMPSWELANPLVLSSSGTVSVDVIEDDPLVSLSIFTYDRPHSINVYNYVYDEFGTRPQKEPDDSFLSRNYYNLFNHSPIDIGGHIGYRVKYNNNDIISPNRRIVGDVTISTEGLLWAPDAVLYHDFFDVTVPDSGVPGEWIQYHIEHDDDGHNITYNLESDGDSFALQRRRSFMASWMPPTNFDFEQFIRSLPFLGTMAIDLVVRIHDIDASQEPPTSADQYKYTEIFRERIQYKAPSIRVLSFTQPPWFIGETISIDFETKHLPDYGYQVSLRAGLPSDSCATPNCEVALSEETFRGSNLHHMEWVVDDEIIQRFSEDYELGDPLGLCLRITEGSSVHFQGECADFTSFMAAKNLSMPAKFLIPWGYRRVLSPLAGRAQSFVVDDNNIATITDEGEVYARLRGGNTFVTTTGVNGTTARTDIEIFEKLRMPRGIEVAVGEETPVWTEQGKYIALRSSNESKVVVIPEEERSLESAGRIIRYVRGESVGYTYLRGTDLDGSIESSRVTVVGGASATPAPSPTPLTSPSPTGAVTPRPAPTSTIGASPTPTPNNLQEPQNIGHLSTGGNIVGIAVSGDFAYLANEGNVDGLGQGLNIVDVSIPEEPRLVGTFPTTGRAGSVTHQGDYIYLGTSDNLLIIDVSQPERPSLVGKVDELDPTSVTVSGEHVYVTDYRLGMVIIDASRKTNPIVTGKLKRGVPVAIDVVGNVAFLSTSIGLVTVNVEDKYAPTILGVHESGEKYTDIEVLGNIAYIARRDSNRDDGGLEIFDISSPISPRIIGSLLTQGYESSLVVDIDRAYMVHSFKYDSRDDELEAIDVSNETAPRLIGSTSWRGYGLDITVVDDLLYVAVGTTGLLIYRAP